MKLFKAYPQLEKEHIIFFIFKTNVARLNSPA